MMRLRNVLWKTGDSERKTVIVLRNVFGEENCDGGGSLTLWIRD